MQFFRRVFSSGVPGERRSRHVALLSPGREGSALAATDSPVAWFSIRDLYPAAVRRLVRRQCRERVRACVHT